MAMKHVAVAAVLLGLVSAQDTEFISGLQVNYDEYCDDELTDSVARWGPGSAEDDLGLKWRCYPKTELDWSSRGNCATNCRMDGSGPDGTTPCLGAPDNSTSYVTRHSEINLYADKFCSEEYISELQIIFNGLCQRDTPGNVVRFAIGSQTGGDQDIYQWRCFRSSDLDYSKYGNCAPSCNTGTEIGTGVSGTLPCLGQPSVPSTSHWSRNNAINEVAVQWRSSVCTSAPTAAPTSNPTQHVSGLQIKFDAYCEDELTDSVARWGPGSAGDDLGLKWRCYSKAELDWSSDGNCVPGCLLDGSGPDGTTPCLGAPSNPNSYVTRHSQLVYLHQSECFAAQDYIASGSTLDTPFETRLVGDTMFKCFPDQDMCWKNEHGARERWVIAPKPEAGATAFIRTKELYTTTDGAFRFTQTGDYFSYNDATNPDYRRTFHSAFLPSLSTFTH